MSQGPGPWPGSGAGQPGASAPGHRPPGPGGRAPPEAPGPRAPDPGANPEALGPTRGQGQPPALEPRTRLCQCQPRRARDQNSSETRVAEQKLRSGTKG